MGRGLIRLRRTHRKSRSTQNGTQAGPDPFSTSTRCNSKKGSEFFNGLLAQSPPPAPTTPVAPDPRGDLS